MVAIAAAWVSARNKRRFQQLAQPYSPNVACNVERLRHHLPKAYHMAALHGCPWAHARTCLRAQALQPWSMQILGRTMPSPSSFALPIVMLLASNVFMTFDGRYNAESACHAPSCRRAMVV
jgi:hypothetical protein